MVNLNIDDRILQMMINGIDCLIHHYEEYQMSMEDVMVAASFSMKLQEARGVAVSKDETLDEEPVGSDGEEYNPNMDPEAKMPGHHWVMGKGWVKNH